MNKRYKKYKILPENKILSDGTTVFRIEALKDFKNKQRLIKRGDKGGWIASEDNLSQNGSCWIFDDAIVKNNARIQDTASICDNAIVCNNACVALNSIVKDQAQILDFAILKNALVSDHAIVRQNATIYGTVCDYAQVGGQCHVLGIAAGSTILEDNVFVSKNSLIKTPATIEGSIIIEHSMISYPKKDLINNYFASNANVGCNINKFSGPITKGFQLIPLYYPQADFYNFVAINNNFVSYNIDFVYYKNNFTEKSFGFLASKILKAYPFNRKEILGNKIVNLLFEYVKTIFLSDDYKNFNALSYNLISQVKADQSPSGAKKIEENEELIHEILKKYIICQFLSILIWCVVPYKAGSVTNILREKQWGNYLTDYANILIIDIKKNNIIGINKDAFLYNYEMLEAISNICNFDTKWIEGELEKIKSKTLPSMKLFCIKRRKK